MIRLKDPSPSLRKITSRSLLIYLGVQVGVGVFFSILNLENFDWLKDLLVPLENTFATFRTAFIKSSTPVASKIFLLIWWVLIIPWGICWIFRFSNGFAPHPSAMRMTILKQVGCFFLFLVLAWLMISLTLLHDHSYYHLHDKPNSPNRGDLVPALMSYGCFTLSIWLAASSILTCTSLAGMPAACRAIYQKLFERKYYDF